MSGYKTVGQIGSDCFTEKKSRFIGHCSPVTCEAEAQAFVKAIQKKHWDASHNVWAYVLRGGLALRYSDDGEPQGTAGIPVLEVLRKSQVEDAVVVVTRYFGGTLLGAGGLVRAYSHGASLALAAAKPIQMRVCLLCTFTCDYKYYTKAQELALQGGAVVDNVTFTDTVVLSLHLPPETEAPLGQKMADLTAGQGKWVRLGEDFYGF